MEIGYKKQRRLLILIIVTMTGLLAYAYYTQVIEYLDPCPLCLTQRFFYLLSGVFSLIAIVRIRVMMWQKIFSVLIMLSSVCGFGTAARQVWLQHLPPEKVPECGPGLQYWLENMPVLKTLELLFKGDGNCAEVDWTFLGLSMAGWSMIMFSLLLIAALWLFFCRVRLTQN